MNISFGIIGTGVIADFHAKAIEAIDGALLTACFDISPERAAEFGAKYNCTPYADIDNFLSHSEMQIVTICTPSGLHLDGALAAAKAGKHLIIEKPLEITIERCDQIIEAGKKYNILITGIFPSRFHAVSQEIKKAIDAGRFGKISLADAYVKWFRSQEYYDSSGWRGTWAMDGGGALMNQSIHAIDLLQWFMGPVEEIFSLAGIIDHQRIEVEDTAVATLKFKNGGLGVIEGSTAVYPGFMKRIEISGSKGSVVMEEEELLTWTFTEEWPEDEKIRQTYTNKTESGGGASDPTAIGFHGHQHQFENMIDAIENGSEILIDGLEARKAVEIIEAIYRSAKSKTLIKLPLD